MPSRGCVIWVATVAVVMASAAGERALSETAHPNLKRGLDIAVGRCSKCHAIGRDDPSPQRTSIPFRDLHTRFPVEMLEEALRTGSIAGHDEMPGFDLGHDDVKALLSYLDSLVPGGPTYVGGQPR